MFVKGGVVGCLLDRSKPIWLLCKCKKSARAQIQCRIVGLFVARKWFVGTSGLKEFLGKLGRFFEKNLHEQTSGYF
jgi:hypothetical protein